MQAISYGNHLPFVESFCIIKHEVNKNARIHEVDVMPGETAVDIIHDSPSRALPVYLLTILKYINDLSIFTRVLGISPLQFVELKMQLNQNDIVKQSWRVLYKDAGLTKDIKDVSLDVKVITIQIIKRLIMSAVDAKGSKKQKAYYISCGSITKLSSIVGWTIVNQGDVSVQEQYVMIDKIIHLAIDGLLPDKQFFIYHTLKKAPTGSTGLNITVDFVFKIIPDIYLFRNTQPGRKEHPIYYTNSNCNSNCYRGFIGVQLNPYTIAPMKYRSQQLQSRGESILNDAYRHISGIPKLIDSQITQYNTDNWQNKIIDNLENLSDQGDTYLSITLVEKQHPRLYAQLIGLEDPDVFISNMIMHKDFFYDMIIDGLAPETQNESDVKQDIFIAIVSAHMSNILIKCGTTLTESVFLMVFGFAPQERHIKLLHRGLILRDITCYGVLNWFLLSGAQETRVAEETVLQLLCTYFKGLDQIIAIQPSVKRVIPSTVYKVSYTEDTPLQYQPKNLYFSNEREIKQYPFPLVVSFLDAISHSTPFLYKIQIVLDEYQHIGASNLLLNKEDIISSLTTFKEEYNLYLEYFTGYRSVKEFSKFVDELVVLLKDDDTLYAILDDDTDDKNKIIYILMILMVMDRDLIIKGLNPFLIIKQYIKPIISPYLQEGLFDKIYSCAQRGASFIAFKYRGIIVDDRVKEILDNMYKGLLPNDKCIVRLQRETTKYPTFQETDYDCISQIKLAAMKEEVKSFDNKSILSGTQLQLIPWVVNDIRIMDLDISSDKNKIIRNAKIPVVSILYGYTLQMSTSSTSVMQNNHFIATYHFTDTYHHISYTQIIDDNSSERGIETDNVVSLSKKYRKRCHTNTVSFNSQDSKSLKRSCTVSNSSKLTSTLNKTKWDLVH